MFNENNITFFIFHNVVAMQAIAVLVKVVRALYTLIALDCMQGFLNVGGFGAFAVCDRDCQELDGVIRPG